MNITNGSFAEIGGIGFLAIRINITGQNTLGFDAGLLRNSFNGIPEAAYAAE